MRGLGQGHALGHDQLSPTIVNIVPIDEIDPVRQVAVAECLVKAGGFIKRQPPAGIDHQIEIGIAPRPAGRPRPEHPCLGAMRQMHMEDIQHKPPVINRQVERAGVGSWEPPPQFGIEVLGFFQEGRDSGGDPQSHPGIVSVARAGPHFAKTPPGLPIASQ